MKFAITPTKNVNINAPNGTAMGTALEWIGLPATDAVGPADAMME